MAGFYNRGPASYPVGAGTAGNRVYRAEQAQAVAALALASAQAAVSAAADSAVPAFAVDRGPVAPYAEAGRGAAVASHRKPLWRPRPRSHSQSSDISLVAPC